MKHNIFSGIPKLITLALLMCTPTTAMPPEDDPSTDSGASRIAVPFAFLGIIAFIGLLYYLHSCCGHRNRVGDLLLGGHLQNPPAPHDETPDTPQQPAQPQRPPNAYADYGTAVPVPPPLPF